MVNTGWIKSKRCVGQSHCVEVSRVYGTGKENTVWTKSRYCANGTCVEAMFVKASSCAAGNCVEAGAVDDHILLRNSTDPSTVLVLTLPDWEDFVSVLSEVHYATSKQEAVLGN